MKSLLIVVAILITLFVTSNVQAATGGATIITDDQDFVWTINDATGTGPNSQNYGLHEFQDLNSDGDFADSGEITLHVNIMDAVCPNNIHISCGAFSIPGGGSGQIIIWRNQSTAHKVGNFTLSATLENAVGTIISAHSIGIRIIPAISTNEQLRQTEIRLNSTIDGFSCVSQPCTQYLSSRINATNCLDNICSSGAVNESKLNETLNITLTKFASDCHGTGTNLCINGHITNTTMDNTVIVLLILGFLMALTWAGIQPGFGFPAIALFGGLGYILFLLTNVEYLPNIPGTGQILVMLGLIPIVLGGFNFNKQRNDNKTNN